MKTMYDIQQYEDKSWYAELSLLLGKGYCTLAKETIQDILDACRKLKFYAGYRKFFNRDYIIKCGEHDYYRLKRQDCLLHFLETAEAELTAYAEDYTWRTPKPGMLKEWADAAFRYERLKQMLDEIYKFRDDFEETVKVYVGKIDGWDTDVTKTEDPHPYIVFVDFGVEYTGDTYSGRDDSVRLNIDHEIGIKWFINGYYDVERHKRYDEGKDTTLRAYVNRINYIKKLEWVEP